MRLKRPPPILASSSLPAPARPTKPASWPRNTGKKRLSDLKVVTVPCAGAVSVPHILSAFAGGAAGVMVLTCHIDNCHSETGNRHARQRVDYLVDHLNRMGFGGDRLEMATLAANMPTEYADMIRRFSRKIQKHVNQR